MRAGDATACRHRRRFFSVLNEQTKYQAPDNEGIGKLATARATGAARALAIQKRAEMPLGRQDHATVLGAPVAIVPTRTTSPSEYLGSVLAPRLVALPVPLCCRVVCKKPTRKKSTAIARRCLIYFFCPAPPTMEVWTEAVGRNHGTELVGCARLELATNGLKVRCSTD